MREIQFRGKRIDTNEWVYGYLIGDDVIVGKIVEFTDDYFNTEFWYKVDPNTVGQFTGLQDKHGKEIYEGDVIQPRYNRFKPIAVQFVNGQYPIREYNLKRCEVIGNIYEDKELLP